MSGIQCKKLFEEHVFFPFGKELLFGVWCDCGCNNAALIDENGHRLKSTDVVERLENWIESMREHGQRARREETKKYWEEVLKEREDDLTRIHDFIREHHEHLALEEV
jgi:hypothetical protein